MNPPSEDIKDLITDSSTGIGDFGVDVFVGDEPPKPNECVTIYDSPGSPSALETDLDYPGVQIRVRGSAGPGGYQGAYAKAQTIKNLLHGDYQRTINNARYLLIEAMSDVLFIGKDDRNRPIFTINFNLMRTTSS